MRKPRVPLRRRALGAAVAVSVLALAACSGTDDGSSSSGTGKPVSGGSLTFATNTDGPASTRTRARPMSTASTPARSLTPWSR